MKAAIVTGIALLLVLAASASAGNRVSYPDPTGDASTGKLDVTSVAVQVNNAGSIFTFRIASADIPAPPSDAFVFFAFDTDNNQTDGNKGSGTDLVVSYSAADGRLTYSKSNGSSFVFLKSVSDPSLVSYSANAVTLTIDLTDLLQAPILHFVAAAGRGAPDANLTGYDLVPDSGFATFWVNPRVQFATAHFFPAFPRAGRAFEVPDVVVFLQSGEEVDPDSFACRATLAGKKLVGKGDGGCRWTIPKKAKRKRLLIRITYSFQGVSGRTAAYDFRVG